MLMYNLYGFNDIHFKTKDYDRSENIHRVCKINHITILTYKSHGSSFTIQILNTDNLDPPHFVLTRTGDNTLAIKFGVAGEVFLE